MPAGWRLLAILPLLLVTTGAVADGQRGKEPGKTAPSLVLHLSPPVDVSRLDLHYYMTMTGNSGGGGLIRPVPGVYDYTIEMEIDGRRARSFKAYAYLPGSGFVVVALDLEQLPASLTLPVSFSPLGTIPLHGRVVAADAEPIVGGRIEARYWADWSCDVFGLLDCFLGPIPVASGALAEDGAFTLDVPDFARDPSLATVEKGHFSFVARSARGTALRLEDSAPGGLAVALRYDDIVRLRAQGPS